MSTRLQLPHLAWHNKPDLELPVPDNWQVETCNMAGYDAPAMIPEGIKAALDSPIDTPAIRELAKNRHDAVIIVDDMTRVTRAADIIPFILEELAEGGIAEDRIRFISALGCHGAMSREDFSRKLGEDVVSRYTAYNHKAFEDGCTSIGTISHGIEIRANTEVMNCDLKIAIGSIEPHILFGFGGGSKIILPGVCSLETNKAFHRVGAELNQKYPDKFGGLGAYRDNPMREVVDEAAELVGLDMKIDTIFNMRGEIANLYAGTPRKTFAAGVIEAEKHYLTPRAKDKDIVIANTYAKVSEPNSAISLAMPSVSQNGGDLVLICGNPEGHVVHFLFGAFGKGKVDTPSRVHGLPSHINRFIIFTQYPEGNFICGFRPAEKVYVADTWDKVLDILENDGTGKTRQVAIYPGAEIQYCKEG